MGQKGRGEKERETGGSSNGIITNTTVGSTYFVVNRISRNPDVESEKKKKKKKKEEERREKASKPWSTTISTPLLSFGLGTQ